MPKQMKRETVSSKAPKRPKGGGGGKAKNSVAKPELPEMKVAVGEGIRRLPVYLLLDTSGSMRGAPIEAVRHGVEQFKREIEQDTFAKETVHLGVITFGGKAEFVTRGLIPFDSFEPPALPASGETPLGQALWLLNESLDKDVKSAVRGGEKGDWKPLVFIYTDGQPTDDWQEPREEILRRQTKEVINIITVGCGPHIDQQALKDIAIGPTFNMGSDGVSFEAFFKWVTQSVIATSRAVSQPGGGDKTVTMPMPPEEMQYIP